MPYTKASTRVDKSIPPNYSTGAYHKTCALCSDNFMTLSYTGKYCSQRCINDAYIQRRRERHLATNHTKALTCTVCDTKLQQGSGKAKAYCSNACKQKAYRTRKRQPRLVSPKQET